jgi:hypothetical protein
MCWLHDDDDNCSLSNMSLLIYNGKGKHARLILKQRSDENEQTSKWMIVKHLFIKQFTCVDSLLASAVA